MLVYTVHVHLSYSIIFSLKKSARYPSFKELLRAAMAVVTLDTHQKRTLYVQEVETRMEWLISY